MERAFKGIWIDKKIWLDPDLLLLEKVLIAEIDSLEGENGCFAGNEYFANFFGVAKGTIANLLSKLSKKNYIKVESDFGANRRIFVNPEIKGVHSEMKGGSRRNERGVHVEMKGGSRRNETYNKEDNKEDNNTPHGDVFERQVTEILEKLNDLSGRSLPTLGKRSESSRSKVKGLLKKGYTGGEISEVVQLKCFEWGNNPEMFQYLHPTTLFRPSNFQKYLDCLNDLKSNPQKANQFKKKINGLNNRNSGPTAKDILPDETVRIVMENLHREGFFNQ